MFTENAEIKKHKDTIRQILLIVGPSKAKIELCLQHIHIMEEKAGELFEIKGNLTACRLNATHVLV